MPYTISIQSTAMVHAPGCFAYLMRAMKGKAADRKVAREAFATGLFLCPEVIAEIERGNVCAETDPADPLNGRLLITVRGELEAPQLAYLRKHCPAALAPSDASEA